MKYYLNLNHRILETIYFISLILIIVIVPCQIPQENLINLSPVFLTFRDHKVTRWEEDNEDSVAKQQLWHQPAREPLVHHQKDWGLQLKRCFVRMWERGEEDWSDKAGYQGASHWFILSMQLNQWTDFQ